MVAMVQTTSLPFLAAFAQALLEVKTLRKAALYYRFVWFLDDEDNKGHLLVVQKSPAWKVKLRRKSCRGSHAQYG